MNPMINFLTTRNTIPLATLSDFNDASGDEGHKGLKKEEKIFTNS